MSNIVLLHKDILHSFNYFQLYVNGQINEGLKELIWQKKLTSPRQKETHLYRDNLNFCLPKFYSGSAATNPAHNEAQEVHHKQKGHHQKLQ